MALAALGRAGEAVDQNRILARDLEQRAAALTQQLLAFSRRQMIQPKQVDLNHIITNLEKMLRRVIGDVDMFVGATPQHDDITCLLAKLNNSPAA